LYETVSELDVPIFVHPALVPTGYEHLKDYDLPGVLGREVDLRWRQRDLSPAACSTVSPNSRSSWRILAGYCGGEGPPRGKRLSLQHAQETFCRILRHGLFRHGRIRRRSGGRLTLRSRAFAPSDWCSLATTRRTSPGEYRYRRGNE
jgi:hypothetical protein